MGTTLPFDCDASLDNAERAWSEEKKAWCCKNEKKGCLFDCDEGGWSNWYRGWSDEKKSWCCVSTMGARGCTTSTTQTTTTTTTLNAQCTTKSPKKPEAWCKKRCNNSKKMPSVMPKDLHFRMCLRGK